MKIEISHGSGGKRTADLIDGMFLKYFGNPILNCMEDAARFSISGRLAFTTDSFVVQPYIFPGGDIGKLAVCGTVNDLAVSGAKPLYMTAAFILEEGLDIDVLESIVSSMAAAAHQAGAMIVAGDTKVVRHGDADGIFINTTGIGIIEAGMNVSIRNAKPGDKIIVTGTVGEHGMAVLNAREGFFDGDELVSDCAPIIDMLAELFPLKDKVHVMRDPTRGGIGVVLHEIAQGSRCGIIIHEVDIPVSPAVKAGCELLGIEPYYLACEGRTVIAAEAEAAERILNILHAHPLGRQAAIIGEVTDEVAGVVVETAIGTRRILSYPTGELLPRIC